jgi:hypothetical protein
MSPKIEPLERPWGNRSGLPARVPAPDLVHQAAALRGEPEPIRSILVEGLIINSRQEWRGDEEDILSAAYGDPAEYWKTQLEKPRSLESFAHLISRHLIDPVEKPFAFGDRYVTAVEAHVLIALRNKRDLPDDPGAAVLWLLASPTYRGLVPQTLRIALEGSETGKTTPQSSPRSEAGMPPGGKEISGNDRSAGGAGQSEIGTNREAAEVACRQRVAGLIESAESKDTSIGQLAEWIFARHQTKRSFDKLYEEARGDSKITGLRKADLLTAFQKVYDTKPHRPPVTGWPLRSPYNERLEQ